jgi:2-hydroxy-6-oxonona-2,4-dienedioate hydrolase
MSFAPTPATSRYIVVPCVRGDAGNAYGVRTHYTEAGDGPPVILVHGGGVGGSGELAWEAVLPRLATRFRALAIDLLWSGRTDKPALPYSLRTQADHLAGFIDALGLEQVSLIGQSIGAYIAARYTCDYPRRVRRLTLVGSNTVGLMMGAEVGAHAWTEEALKAPVNEEASVRAQLSTLLHDKTMITDERVAAYVALRRLPGVAEAKASMAPFVRALVTRDPDVWQEASLLYRLPEITVPICMIWGKDDEFASVTIGHQLREMLPKAEYHELDHAGHHVFHDRPDQFCTIVANFLTSEPPSEHQDGR